jgi:hypothetical protein
MLSFFFLFFFKQIYHLEPYSIEKKLFQLMIRFFLFLFLFSNKLVFFEPYSTEKKKHFQIIIKLLFYFLEQTCLYGALFHLGALGDCLARLMVEPALKRKKYKNEK